MPRPSWKWISTCGVRDGEPGAADQFVDPVCSALFQGVVDGGEEQLLGGENVIGLICQELLEGGGHVGDAQGPELVVVDAGEHHSSP